MTDSWLDKKNAEYILHDMCQSIRYRGPDDHGVSLLGFGADDMGLKVGLGHNRLSIIDLSDSGRQPIGNEDKSIWLTYNGEIYNFIELKKYLEQKGHRFRTKTDSEVIVHGYEEWGEALIGKLNGMFAFALWDNRQKLLMLVRDRMGQKPLYYAVIDNGIIFASEPKAILRFPGFQKNLDMLSLQKYFLYEYVPSPHTIYKNMNRLEAASLLIWKNKDIAIRRYWNISFGANSSGDVNILRDLLADSIKKQLMSDVPLGAFLSGGIDSSTIVSLMNKILPSELIKTFNIGFKDKSFDESRFAREVSAYFKVRHHESILDSDAMLEIIPEILDFMDEPFADPSIIPTYLLSKFTKEHVTVALSGDGGDELFAGYDTFPAHKLARIYEKMPTFIKKYLIEKIVYSLPVSLDNISFDFKLKQFLKGMAYEPNIRNQIWLGAFSPQEQKNLFRDRLAINTEDDVFHDIYVSLKECDARNYLDSIIYLYCKFYLQDDILAKVDRASMACSLEVRSPFLDHRLLEYVFGLNVSQKLNGFTTKYILKKAMKADLPKGVVDRPKKGFGIPVAKWIRSDLRDMITDELAVDKIKRENILNYTYVQELLSEHLKGARDNRKQLWAILIFELWQKRWYRDR